MVLLDGEKLANEINSSLKSKIKNLHENNIFPGLGIILIGNNKESITYIRMKKKSCTDLKIQFFFKKLPEKTTVLAPELIEKLITKVKKNCTTKFDESIDISLQINHKQKKNEIN